MGIFQGEWWGANRVFYTIQHPMEEVPVVTAACPTPGCTSEVSKIQCSGRTLSFAQCDYEVPGDPAGPATNAAGDASALTSRWEVVMQVSMGDPNRILLEMRRADPPALMKRLLRRHLRPSDFLCASNAVSTNEVSPCP
jgi:hypothetical protein